jgi:hypothetical protein
VKKPPSFEQQPHTEVGLGAPGTAFKESTATPNSPDRDPQTTPTEPPLDAASAALWDLHAAGWDSAAIARGLGRTWTAGGASRPSQRRSGAALSASMDSRKAVTETMSPILSRSDAGSVLHHDFTLRFYTTIFTNYQ